MEPLLSQAPFPLSLCPLLHILFIQVCLELGEGLKLVCQLSVFHSYVPMRSQQFS